MPGRRDFLSTSVVIAGLTAPLCRVLACGKVAPIVNSDELWKYRFQFSSAGNGDKSVPITVDPHAHIFNAEDVPIKGYFCGPLAHEKLPSWMQPAANALAPWIERWARLWAPCVKHELKELRDLVRESKKRAVGDVNANSNQLFQDEVNRRRTERERSFADHFARDVIFRHIGATSFSAHRSQGVFGA
jgi:hypothetical protein